jgi:branched-chain amino acid transport system substrate-binding protein
MASPHAVIHRSAWVVAIAALVLATPFATLAAGDPVEINVVVPLTGSVALIGQSAAKALTILQDDVNKTGGINGRPVKFTLVDDQSNPQLDVQLATRIIATKPAVVLGPNLGASCGAIAPLFKDGPVNMCFSPGIHPDEGSFIFSAAPSTLDLAIVTARYAHRRNWKKMAFIFSTDGSGIDGEKVITQTFQAPENKDVTLVDIEHFGVTDLSVAAQVARIKAAQPDAIYVWASGTPSSTAMRAISDAGLDVPVLTSYSNSTFGQMSAFKGYLPKELLMAGIPTMVPPEDLPRGQLRDRVAAYGREFRAAGIRPDALQTTPWDSGLLIVDALRHIGANATAEQLRAYLAGLRGFTGATGTYDFRAIPQRGVNWKSSVLMTRWDPAKETFVAAGPLGG